MVEIDGIRIILSSLIDTVDELARVFEQDGRDMGDIRAHLGVLRESVWTEGRP